MTPEMRDEPVKEAAEDLEQDADRLEGKNSELADDIDEAKDAAQLTAEQADPEAGGPVGETAGDWEGQARDDEDSSGAEDQRHPACGE